MSLLPPHSIKGELVKHVRKRLTYANVMSSIAVFFVLGGGVAFAALGKNTVGTKQLKRNAVKVGKIGPEAVKAGKLAKNSIATNRIREGAVSTAQLAALAVTTAKLDKEAVNKERLGKEAVLTDKLAKLAVTNDKLANFAVSNAKIGNLAVSNAKIGNNSVSQEKVATDAIGAAQLKNIVTRTNSVVIASGGSEAVSASCLGGEQVIGVGTSWGAFGANRYTNYAHVVGNGVTARGNQFTGINQTFIVEAYCLST